MSTVIKTWQIVDSALKRLEDTTMSEQGRLESELERWIISNPEILGTDIRIIGNQVETDFGDKIDLLGIDSSGNTVIIELKRGSLPPREVLAQAIDYAANVAKWKDGAKLDDACMKHKKKTLREFFNEEFDPDQDIPFNTTQKIILVGFAIEMRLEGMIEWLSESYGVDINAIILSYIKTEEGHELLVKTSILDETTEEDLEKRLRLEYWAEFLDYLQERNSTIKFAKSTPWSYLAIRLSKFASLGSLVYMRRKKIGVRLYITGPNAKIYFKMLQDKKAEIDNQFGETASQLKWKEAAEMTKSISLFKDVDDFEDHSKQEQYKWLQENLEAFYKVFANRISSLEEIDEPNEIDETADV